LFYNKVNDYIQGVAGIYSATVLKYTNIDAELYGVDGSWKYAATHNLGLSGIVSYVRGKRTDVSDNLYRIAPLRASINADYAMGQWQHRAEWQLADRQDKVSANNGETATAGHGLFNLRTSYKFDKKATLSAGVENLFDKYYADHLGGVNRVTGSVVAVGEHLPGAGRFGYVSADYRW
jgi:iron complex outermembrane recepter protein